MNLYRTNAASYFCLDENNSGSAAGTGGAAPASSSPTAAPTAPASPAPAASPASPTAPSSEPAAGSDPFAGFETAGDDDGFDTLDLGAATEPSPEPGASPPSPASAPAPTPAPAAPAAPAATPPVVEPGAAQPQAPAGNESTSPRSPLEETIDGFTKNSADLANWAAQNVFKLSKEDGEALELNAVEVIPKLMGRVQVEALKGAANLLRNFVPQMIQQEVARISGSTQKAQEALNEFYTSNPHLNAKDHGATVDKWAKAFRAANPKASRKEAIDYVGRAVSFEHNLTPGQPRAAQQPPFAPARPGGRQPTQQAVDDPFAGLDQDFDEG